MSPTRVVTVLLPLVPVIITVGQRVKRQPSSSSPITSVPEARACSISGRRWSTPGLSTMSRAQAKSSAR